MSKLTFALTKPLSKAAALTTPIGALRLPGGFILSGVLSVPGAPTIGIATQVTSTSVSVTFTAPASNGGSAITSYTVTSSPGGLTGTGAGSPITVSGLTTGVAYTFTVTATNAVGTGPASAASNSVTPAFVYATYNDADTGANNSFSGNKLTVTETNPGANPTLTGVRATQGKSTGKWYWENTYVSFVTNDRNFVGVGKLTSSTNGGPGSIDADSWGYYSGSGNKYNNGTSTAFGATYTAGDVIGFKLDADAGTLEILKNNVSQGTITIGAGTWYPMIGGGFNSTAVNTGNFGASAFVYSVPSGYNSGVYI